MYVDALEYHCPPDAKADLKMLCDEFAEFINADLEDKIDAGSPAQQQLPAGVRQALLLPAAAFAAAAADPLPFGQLEHAAHPVPHADFNDKDDAPRATQMQLGQRPNGQGRRQRRLDAEAAIGPYWDPGQPLPPAPLVRDAICGKTCADKDVTSTNGNQQWKRSSWKYTTNMQIDVIEQPPKKLEIPITKMP
jgi:hypothetical protein